MKGSKYLLSIEFSRGQDLASLIHGVTKLVEMIRPNSLNDIVPDQIGLNYFSETRSRLSFLGCPPLYPHSVFLMARFELDSES